MTRVCGGTLLGLDRLDLIRLLVNRALKWTPSRNLRGSLRTLAS